MLNSKLITLGTLAVLTLGLAACSPDKKPDTWSVDAPKIYVKSGSKVGFLSQAAGNPETYDSNMSLTDLNTRSRIFPADAEIYFPSLEQGADPNSFQLSVTSQCTFGTQKKTEQKNLGSAARLPLVAALPSELLVASFTTDTHYSCAMDFLVTNQHGSSYTFHFSSMNMALLDSAPAVSISNYQTKTAIADSQFIALSDIQAIGFDSSTPNQPTTVQVVCDNYQKTKDYLDLTEFHLDELLPSAGSQQTDGTQSAWWKQTCRLRLSSINNPADVRISKQFDVGPATTPTLNLARLGVPCDAALSKTLGMFQVTNPADQPQIFKLSYPTTAQVFTAAMTPAGAQQTGVTLDTGNAKTVTTADGGVWMEIAPGATLIIQLNINNGLSQNFCGGAAAGYNLGSVPSIEQSGRFNSLAEIVSTMTIGSDGHYDLMPMMAGFSQNIDGGHLPETYHSIMSNTGSPTY